ncbi:MAG: hypothetical protein A2X94_05510 [Bdellovibrionales bacterium GWB1_55_8]|nr:MAG: hypothetical protein A2X94_05510 [Bdellovibrionales bacterium GWB1_55_8]
MKPCCFSLLKAAPLFKGLSETELQDVSACAKESRLLRAGHYFRQNDAARRVFVLTHGHVKITQLSTEGTQVFFRVIGPGEIFGIIGGFGENSYPVSAYSEGPATAWSWDTKCLLSLMEKYPKIALNVIQILSRRIQEMQDRFRDLATQRVERRVATALLRLAAKSGTREADGILINMKLSRQDLAEMTGTTLFTVSRLLKTWQTGGLIVSARQRIKLTVPHALAQIADEIPIPTPRTGK